MFQRMLMILNCLFLFVSFQNVLAEEIILGKDSRPLFPAELTERFVGALPSSDKSSQAGKAQDALAESGAVLLGREKRKLPKSRLYGLFRCAATIRSIRSNRSTMPRLTAGCILRPLKSCKK